MAGSKYDILDSLQLAVITHYSSGKFSCLAQASSYISAMLALMSQLVCYVTHLFVMQFSNPSQHAELQKVQKSSQGVKNAHPISLDVTDEKVLDTEVAKHDLVISLILRLP
jgi:hypothetical protein